MSSPGGEVRLERHRDVLVMVIDHPPVNASTAAVRGGLLAGVAELAHAPDLVAGVVVGARDRFVSGSDLSEFEGPLPPPLLPEVIAAIESCPRPVVAALAGHALGGGLELALGCDVRVAAEGTLLGLPEVTLGMSPGAGGTQRLPRLAGRVAALDLVLTGRPIDAAAALDLGIVDAVVPLDSLLEHAVTTARRAPKNPAADRSLPEEDRAEVEQCAAAAVERAGARPQARAAARLVCAAGTQPVAWALLEERRVFDELRSGPEAAALRHLFFAERAAARPVQLRGVTPAPLHTVALLCGARGAGLLAQRLSRAGTTVVGPGADHAATDLVLADEDLTSLDRDLPASIVLVALGGAALPSRPSERLVGLHRSSAGPGPGLGEVLRTGATSATAARTAVDLATRLGLQPLLLAPGRGPVAHRVHAAGAAERTRLLEGIADSSEVDRWLARGAVPDDVDEPARQVIDAMVAEGRRVLAEGAVGDAGDVDVAVVHGYGFPRHLGGPLWWAAGAGGRANFD